MGYPLYRPRRFRQQEGFRRLLRETHLSLDALVMPLFVRAGTRVRAPIASMRGQFQFSVDQLINEARAVHALGVPAVLLIGLDQHKDEREHEHSQRLKPISPVNKEEGAGQQERGEGSRLAEVRGREMPHGQAVLHQSDQVKDHPEGDGAQRHAENFLATPNDRQNGVQQAQRI